MICPTCSKDMGMIAHGKCEHCQTYCGCSFDPTSSSDYCQFHRRAVFLPRILATRAIYKIITYSVYVTEDLGWNMWIHLGRRTNSSLSLLAANREAADLHINEIRNILLNG
jgi:hypothetical protein